MDHSFIPRFVFAPKDRGDTSHVFKASNIEWMNE